MSNFPTDEFVWRHLGPNEFQINKMLSDLGVSSCEELISQIIPQNIVTQKPYQIPDSKSERETLLELKVLSRKNKVFKNYIGMGYYDCMTPSVILRNIMENPGWYTQYTPYQAEISQGRLEALLNFQTMVCDLTGLPVSNASLLDEATAASEAMSMCWAIKGYDYKSFFISKDCHPQTLDVVKTRADALGISLIIEDHHQFKFDKPIFGALVSYPDTKGKLEDHTDFMTKVHQADALNVVACDLLSLTLFKEPSQMGADIAVGSAQRLGVPLGFGGPHAAFLATKDEFQRKIPGRVVGVSKDAKGKMAYRLALQTREQHIRRDKATSNICTAQVLLAVMSSMYAVYHGPHGLKAIAKECFRLTCLLKESLTKMGIEVCDFKFFDTIQIKFTKTESQKIYDKALENEINLRLFEDNSIGISIDETTNESDVEKLVRIFAEVLNKKFVFNTSTSLSIDSDLMRKTDYLTHPVFNSYHSETEMLRYMHRLEAKDLSLNVSMIPLGSCTMKLNSTTEMMPVTWNGFSKLHPFAPKNQTDGYQELITELENWLADLTGFQAISLQPNAGSQGEYAGLLVIRKYLESMNQNNRDVCLIPSSAHGTNPASAVMAGMKVVVVNCDANGNIDLKDLENKASLYSENLAALMVTYPSTHGVFEEQIRKICDVVHQHGGQVYMDGANFNAQVGICRPGEYGADVCHLNLHKTFCIPHGGGGPGMGPIGVAAHLAKFLPSHAVVKTGGNNPIGTISASPWGSASILPISYAYIKMMGAQGLKLATQIAILNANTIAKKLDPHYPILYKGKNGLVAHECIIDLRQIKKTSGVTVEDVAKRLMDYGFHAPTVSFPVADTLMIEPTESESLIEIERFCEAMIQIRLEIKEIEDGKMDKQNNPLKNAPHTAEVIAEDNWNYPYSRQKAVYPAAWLKNHKYWPPVARIDNAFGDRNFICSCPSIDEYES